MMELQVSTKAGWLDGKLPSNVQVARGSVIKGDLAFKRFHAKKRRALIIGENCTMDGVHFDLGVQGRVRIGDFCYFTNTVLLCELEVLIGSYVMIGWNTTISDTDFHPLAPAERIADAIACSPLGRDRRRPKILKKKVVIEDDVWIGPNATILKGVRIGRGAFVDAGSMVTRDVAARDRVMGNPAQVIGKAR